MIGASRADAATIETAREVGERLAAAGAILLTGGRGGVMEAASRGAAQGGGMTVGILPGCDRAQANQWVRVAIPTGLGELRNGLLVRAADALIAVGGGYGTLSEIALGLQANKVVIGLGSWSIDGVRAADSPAQAVGWALAAAAPRGEDGTG
ncbi:MAG TPA: TIGR00725 family protein [Solirubrobacteraceae bacterium]|nr:TIGR00725 family protein [Solirubrobacteraceae bacterium]